MVGITKKCNINPSEYQSKCNINPSEYQSKVTLQTALGLVVVPLVVHNICISVVVTIGKSSRVVLQLITSDSDIRILQKYYLVQQQ